MKHRRAAFQMTERDPRTPELGGALRRKRSFQNDTDGAARRATLRAPPMPATIDQLLKVCREVIAPLVRADGGEVYLVAVEPDHLTLHLAGTCSGCPGAVLTTRGVIEPAVHAVAPTARVVVTSGARVPEGASIVT
jgi:Fe-S cluster biogenesis protein NfuA